MVGWGESGIEEEGEGNYGRQGRGEIKKLNWKDHRDGCRFACHR